jgi:hypothetical protein
MRRRILLILQFWGLKKADLQEFFWEGYKTEFMQTLTELGKTLLENDNTNAMLLTGCTEIPAKAIADIFGFGEVICTEFASRGGRITGIRRDTYGNLKKQYITKGTERLIYYTDDPLTENELEEVVDEIVIVKWQPS